jgi:hypothetical protein
MLVVNGNFMITVTKNFYDFCGINSVKLKLYNQSFCSVSSCYLSYMNSLSNKLLFFLHLFVANPLYYHHTSHDKTFFHRHDSIFFLFHPFMNSRSISQNSHFSYRIFHILPFIKLILLCKICLCNCLFALWFVCDDCVGESRCCCVITQCYEKTYLNFEIDSYPPP